MQNIITNEAGGEMSFVIRHRLWEPFTNGKGIDIGAGEFPYPGADIIDIRHTSKTRISIYPTYVTAAHKLDMIQDETYDYLVACHLMEHLRDDEVFIALSEWLRILKPNGFLLIMVPHRFYFNKIKDEHFQEFDVPLLLKYFQPYNKILHYIRIASYTEDYKQMPQKIIDEDEFPHHNKFWQDVVGSPPMHVERGHHIELVARKTLREIPDKCNCGYCWYPEE